MTRIEKTVYAIGLATLAAWLGYAAVASAEEPPRKGRCIFITEADGTLAIVCPRGGK